MSSRPDFTKPRRPSGLHARVPALLQQPAYLWVLFAGLIANVFSGNTKAMGLPIGPDRLLLPAAILLLLLDPRRPHLRWRVVHTAMVALLALTAISMVTSGTLRDPVAQFALLDRMLVPFIMFCCAPAIFDSASTRLLLLRFLTLIGLWLSMTTFLEIFGPHALVWPRYIVAAIPTDEVHRASGPFLASEALGMALLTSALSALALTLTERRTWRFVAVASSASCLMASVLTLTRSVWLGAVLGCLVFFAVVPAMRRTLWIVLGLSLVAGLAVVAAFPDLTSNVSDRFETSRSLFDRANTNAAALRVVDRLPLTGVGWGRFVVIGAEWVRQDPDMPLTNVGIEVHNVFLSRAAELGIPGAALFLACVVLGPGTVLWRMRHTRDRAWLGLVAASFCVWIVPSLTSPNPYPYPNIMFWLLTGVLGAGLLTRPRAEGPGNTATSLTPTGAPS